MATGDIPMRSSGGIQDIQSLLDIFTGKTTTTDTSTSSNETSGSVTGSQEIVDPAKAQELVSSMLGGTSGLAAISSGQHAVGLYNSSTNSLLVNDLIARTAGQVAALSATKLSATNSAGTKNGTSSTNTTQQAQANALKAAAAVAAAAAVKKLLGQQSSSKASPKQQQQNSQKTQQQKQQDQNKSDVDTTNADYNNTDGSNSTPEDYGLNPADLFGDFKGNEDTTPVSEDTNSGDLSGDMSDFNAADLGLNGPDDNPVDFTNTDNSGDFTDTSGDNTDNSGDTSVDDGLDEVDLGNGETDFMDSIDTSNEGE